jgi:CRP-like cAMP-binding protein
MSLEDDVRDLARNATLRALEPEALRLIAFAAETRSLEAGEILFQRGDASDGGYVLRSGAIILEAGANATVALPPTLIGDTALITETRRPATARAGEASSLLKISRVLFRRALTEYPDSAARIRRMMAERLIALSDDLEKARVSTFDT